MRCFPLFLLLLLLPSCQTGEEARPFQLSGALENPVTGSITLSGGEVLEKAQLENGQFHLTVNGEEAGYFTLWHDRQRVRLFLRPGDDLKVKADVKNWDESLVFEGEGAAANAFLQEQNRRKADLYAAQGSFQEMTKLEEAVFRRELEQIYEELFEALQYFEDTHSQKEGPFAELEALRLELEHATRLLKYPEAHAYFSGRANYTPSTGYYHFLNDLDWDEAQVLKLPVFDDFLPAWLDYQALARGSEGRSVNDWLELRLGIIGEEISDPAVRDYAYLTTAGKAMETDGIHLDPELVESAVQRIDSEDLRKELARQYRRWAPLAAGQPAPAFAYKNPAGEPVSLADLRGRYLYVDVWATWCGPCLRELPFLEAYQKQYENSERLAFVSVSIDERPEQWRRFVIEKELKGIQLLADKGWNSQICLDYQISELPRFLLIDPEGRIIDADAPRPSSAELAGMLERLK